MHKTALTSSLLLIWTLWGKRKLNGQFKGASREANQGPRFGLIAEGRNNRGTGEEEERTINTSPQNVSL